MTYISISSSKMLCNHARFSMHMDCKWIVALIIECADIRDIDVTPPSGSGGGGGSG